MANQPRKHHYVPKFHLAGFTLSGKEDGQLFVTDKRQRRKWVSTPAKTAREKDFYRIEGESVDPMEIEKAFAKMEGQFATVVRDTISSERIPSGEGFGVLMNFVAYAAARVPLIRSAQAAFMDRLTKAVSRQAFLGRDGAKLLRELGESGSDEDMKQLQTSIASNDYTINVEQTWHIGTMIAAVDALLPALAQRNWALWKAGDGVPDFVCSDRPVAFNPKERRPPLFPIGFGTPKTLLSVPLNRRLLLVSQFEEMHAETRIMDRKEVALMNSLRAHFALQVYSSEEEWLWAGNEPTLGAQAYLESLGEMPQSSDEN